MPTHNAHTCIPKDSVELGDQVFARMDNEGTLELFLYDGIRCFNLIYLDTPVVDNLIKVLQKAGHCDV